MNESGIASSPRSGPTLVEIADAVSNTYGDVKVVHLVVSGLSVGQTPPRLKKVARRVEAELRTAIDAHGIGPALTSWERLGNRMGLSAIDDLPAPRALVETVLHGRTLPKINFVVDAANVTALKYKTPVGAFDLEKLTPPIRLRLASEGELLTPIGATDSVRCLRDEIVYADAHQVFSRYSRDADFSKITHDTTRVLYVIDGTPDMEVATLLEAAGYLRDLIRDLAGPDVGIAGPTIAPSGSA